MPLLHLAIPYDEELMAKVRQVPGAYWNRTMKLWEVKASAEVSSAIDELGLRDRVVVAETQSGSEESAASAKTGRGEREGSDEASAKTRPSRSNARESADAKPPTADRSAITQLEETLMREGAAHSTIKSYRSALGMLASWWQRPLKEATRDDLLAYLTYCLNEKHYSRATMNQVVNAIRAYYERVLGRDKDELRLPRPRKKRTLPNVCSEEEALRMLRSVRNLKHRTILTLIYGLGLRKGEVQKLLVSHVDLKRGVVHVAQAKGNKDRVLALQTTLCDQVGRYLAEYRPQHWLFEGQAGGQYSATSIQAIFVRAKEASGLPDQLTVHGLRHSYATHMVERGTPLHVVKDLLGHESIQTTQVYLHTSSQRFKGLYDPLAGL